MTIHLGKRTDRTRHSESGIALITALLSLFVLSLVVSTMISTSQQVIWTTANFRSTTQARYIAESGAQAAIYYLKNTWTVPSSSLFTTSTYPVTFAGGSTNVVMANATVGALSDTYSTVDSASDTAFASRLSTIQTALQNVTPNAKIAVAAQLLFMNTSTNLTRWRITSRGSVSGGMLSSSVGSGIAQVEEIVEITPGGVTNVPVNFPGFSYGGFATGTGCGSIYMSGGSSTNAYNTVAQSPNMVNTGGSMATFGNATLTGSSLILGNLYAPGYAKYDTTQGSGSIKQLGVTGIAANGKTYNNNDGCSSTDSPKYAEFIQNSFSSGVDCTATSTSNCSNDPQPIPSAYTTTTYGTAAYPTIANSSTLEAPPTNSGTCTYGSNYANPPVCAGGSGGGSPNGAVYGYYNPTITIPPSDANPSSIVNYGQVTFGGATTITLQPGTYYFDTLTLTGSASIAMPPTGNVIIYILNASGSSTPINFTGGSVTNNSYNPAQLMFVYNGTQNISISSISNNAFYGTFYAPNASATFSSNGALYGAIISKTISITGGGHLYYDSLLANASNGLQITQPVSTPGTFAVTQFSWTPW